MPRLNERKISDDLILLAIGKRNSNEKNVHCHECQFLSFKVLSVAIEIEFLNEGQGLTIIESDPGAICKGFSEI